MTITTHHTNDCNRAIAIDAMFSSHTEEMGSIAPDIYNVRWKPMGWELSIPYTLSLYFQSGSPATFGNNGLTHEVLTAIMIDRLEHFQRGPFACVENEIILSHFKSALAEMAKRSQARVDRGVEGTHQV